MVNNSLEQLKTYKFGEIYRIYCSYYLKMKFTNFKIYTAKTVFVLNNSSS